MPPSSPLSSLSLSFSPSHLEPVHAQQARQDALLESRAEHDGVVGLVHGFSFVFSGGESEREERERKRKEKTMKRKLSTIAQHSFLLLFPRRFFFSLALDSNVVPIKVSRDARRCSLPPPPLWALAGPCSPHRQDPGRHPPRPLRQEQAEPDPRSRRTAPAGARPTFQCAPLLAAAARRGARLHPRSSLALAAVRERSAAGARADRRRGGAGPVRRGQEDLWRRTVSRREDRKFSRFFFLRLSSSPIASSSSSCLLPHLPLFFRRRLASRRAPDSRRRRRAKERAKEAAVARERE